MTEIEHPIPPNPLQHQDRQPTLESEMNPQPLYFDPDFYGSVYSADTRGI